MTGRVLAHQRPVNQETQSTIARAMATTLSPSRVPPIVHEALRTPGQPLDASIRRGMESRFGHDFSQVRVHSDARAMEAADAVGARAFTVGADIVFGPGAYAPATFEGRRTLVHELAHVQQRQRGAVPGNNTGGGLAIIDPGDSLEREARAVANGMPAERHSAGGPTRTAPIGAVQCAPKDEIEVTVVEVSRSESDLLFYDYGIRLPGSPPRVQFGNDGPIQPRDQKAVQLAFDLAYTTAASPLFAAKFGEFKKGMGKQGEANLPGLADLSQQKYLAALGLMRIHLADTSKNALVKNYLQKESQSKERLPVAGYTPVGGSDVYIRAFALAEGRDALASLILHESVHVAGLPTKPINEFLETIMELAAHGFEASVGLPLSQIVERAARIRGVKPHGQGVEFEVSVAKPDNLPADAVRIEIFDGNRRQVFLREQPKAKFTKQFSWDGLDASGKPTESGIHSIRVVAGNVLIAAYDYVLRRRSI